jgi:hypothetical protein
VLLWLHAAPVELNFSTIIPQLLLENNYLKRQSAIPAKKVFVNQALKYFPLKMAFSIWLKGP